MSACTHGKLIIELDQDDGQIQLHCAICSVLIGRSNPSSGRSVGYALRRWPFALGEGLAIVSDTPCA